MVNNKPENRWILQYGIMYDGDKSLYVADISISSKTLMEYSLGNTVSPLHTAIGDHKCAMANIIVDINERKYIKNRWATSKYEMTMIVPETVLGMFTFSGIQLDTIFID